MRGQRKRGRTSSGRRTEERTGRCILNLAKSVLCEACTPLNWLCICACLLMKGRLINHSVNDTVTILKKFVAGVATAHHANFIVV